MLHTLGPLLLILSFESPTYLPFFWPLTWIHFYDLPKNIFEKKMWKLKKSKLKLMMYLSILSLNFCEAKHLFCFCLIFWLDKKMNYNVSKIIAFLVQQIIKVIEKMNDGAASFVFRNYVKLKVECKMPFFFFRLMWDISHITLNQPHSPLYTINFIEPILLISMVW